MPTVTGVFTDRETTESAVDHLVESGVDRGAIGVMWKDRSLRQPEEVDAVSTATITKDRAPRLPRQQAVGPSEAQSLGQAPFCSPRPGWLWFRALAPC